MFQGLDQGRAAEVSDDQSGEGLGFHIGGGRTDQDAVIDGLPHADQFVDDGFQIFFIAGFAAQDILHLVADGSGLGIFNKVREMIQEIFPEEQIVHCAAPRGMERQVSMVFASLGGEVLRRDRFV